MHIHNLQSLNTMKMICQDLEIIKRQGILHLPAALMPQFVFLQNDRARNLPAENKVILPIWDQSPETYKMQTQHENLRLGKTTLAEVSTYKCYTSVPDTTAGYMTYVNTYVPGN